MVCIIFLKADLRSATNAKNVELSLVETHIAQCQTGKQTRQEDKYGNKDDENNGYWMVRVRLARTPAKHWR